MPECNGATTLYGAELRLTLRDRENEFTASWREEVYRRRAARGYHDAQQRWWRLGHGEATDGDIRAQAISGIRHQQLEKYGE